MKKSIITIMVLLSTLIAIAQTTPLDAPQQKTLFGNPTHVGWWVSPDFMYTQYDGNDVFQGGISGGVILNHNFSLGLGGYGIMNSYNLEYDDIFPAESAYLYGGYGGLKVEYRLKPASVLHVAFPLLLGGGSMMYGKDPGVNDPDENEDYISDGFFVFEPGVMMGVNLVKFMRLDIGATYRFASGLELPTVGSDFMNGVSGVVSLKFGKF
jgi:hypothetical protein